MGGKNAFGGFFALSRFFSQFFFLDFLSNFHFRFAAKIFIFVDGSIGELLSVPTLVNQAETLKKCLL